MSGPAATTKSLTLEEIYELAANAPEPKRWGKKSFGNKFGNKNAGGFGNKRFEKKSEPDVETMTLPTKKAASAKPTAKKAPVKKAAAKKTTKKK